MSSIVGKAERYAHLMSDAGAPLAFGVEPSRHSPQPKAPCKPPCTVPKRAPPTDRVDHTELPTLQNLGNLPAHLALVPLYFNNLQRYAGPMFSSEMAGHKSSCRCSR
jgi:hypothetical protein